MAHLGADGRSIVSAALKAALRKFLHVLKVFFIIVRFHNYILLQPTILSNWANATL